MEAYKEITLNITGQIGTIKLNRPQTLNAFGGDTMVETISALRILDNHPETIFTVLTGEGRFFSAGADVRQSSLAPDKTPQKQEKIVSNQIHDENAKNKIKYMSLFAPHLEMLRSVIDHRKVFVLALNGPGVGGGAAWFTGVADIVLASSDCYLQVPFSALGLVPELGSAPILAQSMGVHRANEFLMFGRRIDADELKANGLLNRIFPRQDFQAHVTQYLTQILSTNDGKSLTEAKSLMNRPLRDGRLIAVVNSIERLAERFVTGAPFERFMMKIQELEAKSKNRSSKL